ncbi:MAG: universal stress protein, partial [Chloroflexi bacterium]|nr:universal stress protein [Chloroflexota bacterium]
MQAESQSQRDFERALDRGRRRRFLHRLLRREGKLIPYEDLKRSIDLHEQRYRGLQPVPLDRIIGSLGRSGDFDRVFTPLSQFLQPKWVSVNRASRAGVHLPAVSLYRVGDAYFVVDGHNRVSVARQGGQAFIDAEVIEVASRVPITADLTLDDLDKLEAYRRFLDETHLDVLRPGQNVQLTMPGDYARLLEHIRTHRYFVDMETHREMSADEAVAHWYDHVYEPVVTQIRDRQMLRDFPGMTEADLYFWVIERGYLASLELGRPLAPWELARDFCVQYGRGTRNVVARLLRRMRNALVPQMLQSGPRAGAWRYERVEPAADERLFHEILVALTGAPSSEHAVDQAAAIALRDGGSLRGLHVIPVDTPAAREQGQRIVDTFLERARARGVPATGRVVVGDIVERILDDARWSDLVVINQRREQGHIAERPLGTIFQGVTSGVARPILAVPGAAAEQFNRVVLAYDASPKSR